MDLIMSNLRIGLRFCLGAVFGLCAADGILQVRGLRLLTPFWENTATALFFLLAGLSLCLAWKARDGKAMKRLRLWSAGVLGGSTALLVILFFAMLSSAHPAFLTGLTYALAVVSAPVSCCTVMFWPIFGWALLLVTSCSLCRRLNKKNQEM